MVHDVEFFVESRASRPQIYSGSAGRMHLLASSCVICRPTLVCVTAANYSVTLSVLYSAMLSVVAHPGAFLTEAKPKQKPNWQRQWVNLDWWGWKVKTRNGCH